jgi:carbonic anhydrase
MCLCRSKHLFCKKTSQKKQVKKTIKKIEIDSVQWKKEHYVINRDSAYADPRLA